MTQDELSALFGIVVSLLFSYFPVVRDWFEPLEGNVKRLIQVGVAAVIAFGVFGLSCAGVLASFSCDVPGVLAVVRLVVAFLIANQTAYSLTPKAK